jgi:hypothetical protein
MALKNCFKDLTTYVIPTGFYDKILISATATAVEVSAVDKDKEAILKGSFSLPAPELIGEFGLSNLGLLGTICSDPEFAFNESAMTVLYETRNAEREPAEISYENRSKSHINYRFMSKNLIPDQPRYLEPKWDVVIRPTKHNIQQFAWAANGLAAYEQYFIPRIVDGDLRFFIGEDDAKTQRGGVVFASDRKETFDSPHRWKIQIVQSILKVADTCECEMAFSVKGAIQITLNTGVGNYRYILPAKVR